MRLLSVLVVSLATALPADGQTTVDIPTPRSGLELRVSMGEAASRALRPADALSAFQDVLAQDPRHYVALWKAARACVSLGGLATEDDEAEDWFHRAEAYARRAVEVEPRGVDGNLWLAVSVGRKALTVGPRARVRLATEIRALALHTLELDSLNAGAHHVLGEWHAEIRRLSGITRWVARELLGGDVFDEASWEKAEHHLSRAVALDSTAATHRLDLGRLYLDLDRSREAEVQLRRVLALPVADPEDPLHKREAEALLSGG